MQILQIWLPERKTETDLTLRIIVKTDGNTLDEQMRRLA